MDTKGQFKQHLLRCASTGDCVVIPKGIDSRDAGNIMADVAASYIDGGEDVKAIIILEERRRLGV